MATILHLSEDVISIILSINNISIQDVLSFSSACKRFREITENNNFIWRQKFYQRWPRLKKICDGETHKAQNINFKELVQARIKSRQELRHFLRQMSKAHYYAEPTFKDANEGFVLYIPHHSVSPFSYDLNVDKTDLNLLIHPNETTHSLNLYFLIDELTNLIERSQREHKDELTNIYYAKHLVSYLKHYHLTNMWEEFISRPAKRQLLEEAATFVAQWYQPEKEISYSHIETELNKIAEQAMELLKIENPKHPIFSTPQEQFSFWKYNNINENQWNDSEGKQILNILCKVLRELNFHGVSYSENRFRKVSFQEILINYVLEGKVGYIVSLAIIFQSVARRLGIRCDLVSFPDHCFLSWKPKYNITNPDDMQCFYIDILHDGALLSKNDCPMIRGATQCPIENFNTYNRINFVELILKLINQIRVTISGQDKNKQKRWLLQLHHLVKPSDIKIIQRLNYDLQHLNHDLQVTSPVSIMKIDRYHESKKGKYKPKKRKMDMKYAVGMLVLIKNIYDENQAPVSGVITGWKKDSLLPGKSQLRYTVHCEETLNYEKVCHSTEGYLERMNTPRPIRNKEIGKFFCEFKGTYYMPNEIYAEEYAEDVLYLINNL